MKGKRGMIVLGIMIVPSCSYFEITIVPYTLQENYIKVPTLYLGTNTIFCNSEC